MQEWEGSFFSAWDVLRITGYREQTNHSSSALPPHIHQHFRRLFRAPVDVSGMTSKTRQKTFDTNTPGRNDRIPQVVGCNNGFVVPLWPPVYREASLMLRPWRNCNVKYWSWFESAQRNYYSQRMDRCLCRAPEFVAVWRFLQKSDLLHLCCGFLWWSLSCLLVVVLPWSCCRLALQLLFL